MSNTSDTRTIYEIFRACRLCGAGGGYKMPIIQNVIPFDCTDFELREKIRECVQIEVKGDDKMPPLICELCVDKVNDFYEFLEMCRQTNKRTRLRLGLPPQAMPQGAPDDCILGVTETVFSNDEEKPQPRSRPCPKSKKNIVAVKKEDEKIETPKSGKEKENGTPLSKRLSKELASLKDSAQKVNTESPATRNRGSRNYAESRSSSVSSRSSPIPSRRRNTDFEQCETPRTRAHRDSITSNSSARKSTNDENISLGKIKQQEQKKKQEQQKQTARNILKKGKDTVKGEISSDSDNEALSTTRSKRGGHQDTPRPDVPSKRIKLTIKLPPKPKIPTLRSNECPACGYVASSSQGFASHMRRHFVVFTSPEVACDPCGEWFTDEEEAAAHHRRHARYECRHCRREYKQLAGYYEHFDKTNCRPFDEVPDCKCKTCWAFFPTTNLLKQHKCPGTGFREGGLCKLCSKPFATLKSLKKHEDYCLSKIKDSKPAKSEASKPAKIEVSKPTRNEIFRPTRNEVSRPTRNAVSKPVKKEISKPTRNEASKPGPKSTRSVVRISPKVRSRLRPATVRVAKCDPLLKTRKSRSGRYNVENVPHDYGLDSNCTYPYKYSGVRVKSEPLWFNGMVSINKEIQRELYREEDYVHWDSDLSSDSENDFEELGEKLRKVPTLTALSLKTIFSKQCLGKVPRKLRKVKQDKLFDSLFNATVEYDLSCNINSIIDNLSKDDTSSVNLLNADVNYDSDSVLDKSIVGGDDLDAVIKDVNKNSNIIDVSLNAVTKINDKNDLESKNVNDDDTDASINDTNDNQNDELANTKGDVSEKNVKNDKESDRTDDLSSINGDTQDDTFNPAISNSTENNCENKERTDKEDETTNNETANENQGTNNEIKDINKENQESNNYCEKESNQNMDLNKECNVENQETYNNNEETSKSSDFLNGVTDKIINFSSEIDDKQLMDDLNAQIGESEMKECSNFSIDNLIDKSMPQSFGIGSIGDDDFL